MAIVFIGSSVAAETPTDIDCAARVIDRASVLEQPDRARIEAASQPLVNEGADVHVVTTELGDAPNLDAAVKGLIGSCPSWQSPEGAPKNTVLILAMAPTARKSGIFYGAGWARALDDHWTRIMADEMNPRFRDHDFAGGFIAAEQHLRLRIQAAEDESQHGTTIVNQQQAMDLSGVLATVQWFLLAGILALGFGFFFTMQNRKRAEKERLQAARQDAVLARKQAAEQLASVRAKFVEYDAIGGEKRAEVKTLVEDAAEAYARLAGSTAMDPEQPNLSTSEYKRIAQEFGTISKHANQATALIEGVAPNLTSQPLEIGSQWKPEYTEATSRHPVESARRLCAECLQSYEIGDYPFCPHGRVRPIAGAEGRSVVASPGRTLGTTGSSSSQHSSHDGFLSGLVVASLLSNARMIPRGAGPTRIALPRSPGRATRIPVRPMRAAAPATGARVSLPIAVGRVIGVRPIREAVPVIGKERKGNSL